MTDGTDAALTLDSVVKRFADSERALAQVRERLADLASSAESSEASAAALRESAVAIQALASGAGIVVDELRAVSVQASGVLEGGASVLDGSALRSIEQRVADLQAATSAIAGDVGARLVQFQEESSAAQAAAREATDARLSAIEHRLAALEGMDPKIGEANAGIARIWDALPGRWK